MTAKKLAIAVLTAVGLGFLGLVVKNRRPALTR
jgi:ABC-type dipeptide/oligopeptide/nickel transport system permease subunit